jgi:HSP20 family molecular chaperone IbpA
MLTAHVPLSFASRVFDDLLQAPAVPELAAGVDVVSTEGAVRFLVDVPGFRSEDLDVTVERGVLTITGHRRRALAEGEKLLSAGRGYGRFERRWSLGETVDAEGLVADLAEGVLTVTLPLRAATKARKVAIRTPGESQGSLRPS